MHRQGLLQRIAEVSAQDRISDLDAVVLTPHEEIHRPGAPA
jgi:hypothetical protein